MKGDTFPLLMTTRKILTMNTIRARGILRHRFWGTYSACIGLEFDTPEAAADGLKVLGSTWKNGEINKHILIWTGNSEELEVCKKTLGSFGADVSKIDSVATSIDYGEPFTVSIEVVPTEQVSMF